MTYYRSKSVSWLLMLEEVSVPRPTTYLGNPDCGCGPEAFISFPGAGSWSEYLLKNITLGSETDPKGSPGQMV